VQPKHNFLLVDPIACDKGALHALVAQFTRGSSWIVPRMIISPCTPTDKMIQGKTTRGCIICDPAVGDASHQGIGTEITMDGHVSSVLSLLESIEHT